LPGEFGGCLIPPFMASAPDSITSRFISSCPYQSQR
jgi:hypothetical protein